MTARGVAGAPERSGRRGAGIGSGPELVSCKLGTEGLGGKGTPLVGRGPTLISRPGWCPREGKVTPCPCLDAELKSDGGKGRTREGPCSLKDRGGLAVEGVDWVDPGLLERKDASIRVRNGED